MRLTLRTLLAYLDDTLEPTDAKEIGQKISHSKEAAALVEQIRESLRRRRIGAPELAGPGSGPDPNIVSEYLESALTPDQVVEYEQLCRRSELHLAEVAACHKILTMVMGQPIEVSDELRDRIYALGSSKVAQEAYTTAPPPMTVGMENHGVGNLESGLPEYLTRGRTSSRVWTVLVVVLMAGAWIALVVSDKSIWTAESNDSVVISEPAFTLEEIDDPASATNQAAENAPGPGESLRVNASNTNSKPSRSSPRADATGQSTPRDVSINPLPPPDHEVDPNSIPTPIIDTPGLMTRPNGDATAPQVTPDQSEVVVVSPKDGTSDPVIKAPENGNAATPVPTEPPLVVMPPDGVNIRLVNDTGRWETVKGGSVSPGERFAAPSPFQATLNFEDDLIMDLQANTRLRRLPCSGNVTLSVELEKGRVLIKRPPSSLHESTLAIKIGDRTWQTTFSDPETEIAFAVTLPQPEGMAEADSPGVIGGGVGVKNGEVTLTEEGQNTIKLTAESGWVAWPQPGKPLTIDVVSRMPEWTSPEELLVTPARKQMAKTFEKEFGTDVVRSIAPVIGDRQALISEFATETMVLTENFLEVVPALQSDHQESRIAAIHGLREWLASDADHQVAIREELERRSRPEIVEQVVALLWGYSKSQVQSEEVSLQIVELLGHEDLAVRELAHFYATKWSGRSYGYHAQAPVAERRAAINRWIDYVKREGGLIKPDAPVVETAE